ncbi:MAG: 50S ribosomal protein L35 [Candidatus Wildermuthbacteria bacterium]|nr:50S ribosomal protein L35 [Candidatus Wildermuthbacteria bacterium]
MQKQRKSILKRFKITKSGKVLRRAAGQDHNLSKKSGKRKRKMRKWIQLSRSEVRTIKKMLTF